MSPIDKVKVDWLVSKSIDEHYVSPFACMIKLLFIFYNTSSILSCEAVK